MWTITVKTLDSQNHKFENVDPAKKISDLKELIAGKVNIEAARQRLIFCGRVLQDDKKISDYELDGRVVHLVQRAPPGVNSGPDRVAESEARARSRGASPATRRTEHIHVHANLDIPHTPTIFATQSGTMNQSSPMVRLNLARDMMRNANRVLDRIDRRNNPTEGGSDNSSASSGSGERTSDTANQPNSSSNGNAVDDVPMENLDPSAESDSQRSANQARPSTLTNSNRGDERLGYTSGPIQIEMMSIPVAADGPLLGGQAAAGLAEALSAMLQGSGGPRSGDGRNSMSFRLENGRYVPEEGSGSSSGARGSSRSTRESPDGAASSENAPGASSPSPGVRYPPPNVLAEALEEYHRTNARLMVHQNRLIPILTADETFNEETEQANQQLFNRVSQVTHFLAHAQHAISDIIINFSRPPPRQLRARPFVIQSLVQSAVVQAGPITVNMSEAVSNIGRTPTSGTSSTTRVTAGSVDSSTSSSTGTNTTSTTATSTAPSLENLINHSMFHRAAVAAASAAPSAEASTGSQSTASESSSTGSSSTSSSQPQAGRHTRASSDDIQNIFQNALQDVLRAVPGVVMSASLPMQSQSLGSQSQARSSGPSGTSSAQPSTTTRSGGATPSVSRQQIHIPVGPHHHRIGGSGLLLPPLPPGIGGNMHSFDPFLQCHSHHISLGGGRGGTGSSPSFNSVNLRSSTRSRVQRPSASGSSSNRTSSLDRRSTLNRPRAPPTQGTTWMVAPTGNSASEESDRFYVEFPGGQSASSGSSVDSGLAPPRPMAPSAATGSNLAAQLNQLFAVPGVQSENNPDHMMHVLGGLLQQFMGAMAGPTVNSNTPTIAQFLHTIPDYNFRQGENILMDLVMTLAEHITFQDLLGFLNNSGGNIGNLREPLQNFIREHVLEHREPSRDNILNGLQNLMDQSHTEWERASQHVNVREGIDYTETMISFLSDRPVDLLLLIVNEDMDTFRSRAGPLGRLLAAEGVALSVHVFRDGQTSLERLLQQRIMSTDMHFPTWTAGSVVNHIRSLLQGVPVELDDLRRYIVTTEGSAAARQARSERIKARSSRAADRSAGTSESAAQPAASAAGSAKASATNGSSSQSAPQSESGEERFLTPSEGSPTNMEVDSQSETETEDVSMVPVLIPTIPVVPAEVTVQPQFPASLLTSAANGIREAGGPEGAAGSSSLPPEGWHGAVPQDWVPIIGRDSRQTPPRQTPFSDAYMNGQPSKRRKLNDDQKPRGEVRDIIAEAMQDAIESSGVRPINGPASLVEAVSSNNLVHDAVEEVTKASLQERVEKDPDFNAKKFPSTDKFLKKNK